MDELYAFIQQRRIAGQRDQEIATELLNSGWDPDTVRTALQASSTPTHDRNPSPYKNLIIFGAGALGLIILVIIVVALFNANNDDRTTPANQATSEESQISQRDTLRRSDLQRILAEAERAASLNNGRFPEANQSTFSDLVGAFSDFTDPSTGDTYVFTTAAPTLGQMQYANRVFCNSDRLATGSERNIAFRVFLESGSIACIDNL